MIELENLIKQTQALVSKGRLRKYYRFRWARYYGGIATADCVGCCLRCLFCWSWDIACHPDTAGSFFTPEQVAYHLQKTARKHHGTQMRISGNEPTLNREHLLEVLGYIPFDYGFILETNGILLGLDRSYCSELARFSNLHVRVSLKGCSPSEFIRLTGVGGKGFELQIKALENLVSEGVSCHPALMSFAGAQPVSVLAGHLNAIDPKLADIEEEELIPYPPALERLHRARII